MTNQNPREDKVITQERDVFHSAALYLEFQLASAEAAIGDAQCLPHKHTHVSVFILLPQLTPAHASCICHTYFQILFHLSPCARHSFSSSPHNFSCLHFLCLVALGPSCFFGNKWCAAEDTLLPLVTSLCLPLPHLSPSFIPPSLLPPPCLFQGSNQCCAALCTWFFFSFPSLNPHCLSPSSLSRSPSASLACLVTKQLTALYMAVFFALRTLSLHLPLYLLHLSLARSWRNWWVSTLLFSA